jgi:hypothetical protein
MLGTIASWQASYGFSSLLRSNLSMEKNERREAIQNQSFFLFDRSLNFGAYIDDGKIVMLKLSFPYLNTCSACSRF